MPSLSANTNITEQVQNALPDSVTCTCKGILKYEATCNDSLTLHIGGMGQVALTLCCSLPNRHGGRHEHQWENDKGVIISWK